MSGKGDTDPEKAFFWRDIYSAVRPAYHQNKRHWITIILDGSIPDKDIPCFRVVNARGALAGEFAFGGPGQQAKLLEAEGVEVTDGIVDLSKYQWDGR